MSAYMLSNEKINQLGAYIYYKGFQCQDQRYFFRQIWDVAGGVDLQKVCEALRALNYEAVNARYGDEPTPEAFRFKSKVPMNDFPAYDLLKEFMYQCHEGDCPEKPLYKALNAACNSMAHTLLRQLRARG